MEINKKLIIAKLILKKVIVFYKEHDRLPFNRSKNDNEMKLGRWIGTQRQNKKGTTKGIWHPELETIAIKHGLTTLFFQIDLKQSAIDNLMLVIDFYNEHGKLPSAKSKDKNKAKLGMWIITQRQNKKGKGLGIWYPELETIAIKHGLLTIFTDSKQIAIDKLMLVIEFYNEHGKLPSQYSKDENERKLGVWLSSQRGKKQGKVKGEWYPELETIATEHGLPDLFDNVDLKQIAVDTLWEVITFYRDNKTLPSQRSTDKNESKLGRWITTQRQNKKGKGTGKWYPELEQIAIEHNIPELFEITNLKQIAIDNLMLVIEFYNENGKLPISLSKDENERKLGVWISYQRQAKKIKKSGKWYPELETIATEHGLPDLFDNVDLKQIAIDKLMLVIEFYEKYERRPISKSKDENERKLGAWISNQRKNKKGKGNWYPELETIATEHGLPNLFEITDLKQIAIDVLMLVIAFYNERGKLPSKSSKDENEKKLGAWIGAQRIVKCGNKKTNRVWYPELETIANKHNLPKLFEPQR
jgi:hypothetical protein